MCGIVGIVVSSGLGRLPAESRIKSALVRLANRGPDGQGFWSDEYCAFGHSRLAIIELSELGAQPMSAFRRVITFNGEIFNFREIRAELERHGRRFASQSDTEVLLAGWEEWGEALLPRLVGMFAFAIWDPASRTLTVARDRFGEKPLFYRADGESFAFASDFLALEQAMGATLPIDHDALRLLFALRYIPEPRTIAREVHKLLPGHVLKFSKGRVTIHRWAETLDMPPFEDDESRVFSDLRAAMDGAVSDRLVSDVPVGAFLSSGIDSAIVAATMARNQPRVRTFTVGFRGVSEYYEERPGARSIANYIGADHTEITVDASDALSILDQIFLSLDEPFADSSSVAAYIVSKEARRHVKVALSGDGADEIFAGYRKYQGELFSGYYRRLPLIIRRLGIEPLVANLPESKNTRLLEALRRLKRFISAAGQNQAARHAGWATQLTETELDELFGAKKSITTVASLIANIQSRYSNIDPINLMLATDVEFVLPGDMLVKVDRTSMANGLEIRCPFLDQRVVNIAFSLAGSEKLRPGINKRILRRAFTDRLPKELFRRPKKGFEIPVADWLAGPLRDRVKAATDPERLRRQGLFSPQLPRRWLDQLDSGKRDTSWHLWTMIAFQSWATLTGRPEALT